MLKTGINPEIYPPQCFGLFLINNLLGFDQEMLVNSSNNVWDMIRFWDSNLEQQKETNQNPNPFFYLQFKILYFFEV